MSQRVNLIPSGRRWERLRRRRVRVWATALGAAGAVAAGTCVACRVSLSGLGSGAQTAAQEVEARIERVKMQIEDRQRTLAGLQAALRASELLDDQPDWGLLLVLVGRRLGDETVLTRARLDPVIPEPGAPNAARLDLEGIGRTTEAVSRLTLDLEATGLFAALRLVYTKRIVNEGAYAVSFRIEGVLEGLPGEQP